jgi:regulator of sigma E protease
MDYIFYFILTIGILVFIHEFGHFAAAKMCGIQTDVFAIGFGKRLFGWNKVNGFTWGELPKEFDQKGHTDYRISLLPLGGYVKISGMIDESFDTDFVDKEPQPHEFRSKPTYQKLFVITAGVLMNLLLTVIIFWGSNFIQGKQVILTTQVGLVEPGSIAAEAGFKTGDKILSVSGKKINNWDELTQYLFVDNLGKSVDLSLERNGEKVSFTVPHKYLSGSSAEKLNLPFNQTQPYISDVMKSSPANIAGIAPGDIVLSINNTAVQSSKDVVKIITSNKETDIPLVLLRDKDTVVTTVNPGIQGKIGIAIADIYTGPFKYVSFGFFRSFAKSISDIGRYTMLTFAMFKNVMTGEVAFGQVFGGPVKIAQFAAKSADSGIVSFLYFLAMLSLSLAIINILPFPVLDGGHFVILLIEGLIKRELPIKVKIAIQNVGFVILLMLMAFIIYSDIINL